MEAANLGTNMYHVFASIVQILLTFHRLFILYPSHAITSYKFLINNFILDML